MESLHELGLALIRLFQDTYPQLSGFFEFVSSLGNEIAYLVAMPFIYWCVHKPFGKQLGYLLLISVAVNSILKHLFREPRPYWIDPSLGLSSESDYGLPSGHAQYATAIFLFAAAWVRRRWAWVLAILGMLLMGASRVYLGVHFPTDVLAGYVVGIILLIAAAGWWWYYAEEFSKRILGQKLLAAIAVPLLLSLIYIAIYLIIGAPDLTVAWAAHIPDAERTVIDNMATAVGALFGFATGVVMESSRVRFRAGGPIWQRIARYLLGIAVAVALWAGLDAIFPSDPLWLAVPLRIVRYLLLLLWVAYYGPLVFVRLRLAAADPPLEINMKM